MLVTSNRALRHALGVWQQDCQGELLVNGMPVSQSVAIAGGTPAYLYDRGILRQRLKHLRDVLPPQVGILYSLKANPHPAVVATISSMVNGFDLASGSELSLAVAFASRGYCLQFSGPGKTRSDIERALAAGAVLNVESANQLKMLAAIGNAMNIAPKVCIRVNPSFLPGGSGLRMTGRSTQFGVCSHFISGLVAEARSLNIEPMGLHFYWGTQLLDGAMIADIQTRSWHEAQLLMRELSLNITHLNLGGGFGIPYFQNDEALDIQPIAKGLALIEREFNAASPSGKVMIELGRYIAGEAGLYVASVVDIKETPVETFLVIDGGMHHHLAASGNLGQGLPRSFPCVLPRKLNAAATAEVTVAGCLCTPIDIMARKIPLPAPQIGDLFAILQSGAYGATASPTGFLSHSPPKEQLI